LFKKTVFVKDAITKAGEVVCSERVNKAGGKPAKTSVAECGIVFRFNDLLKVITQVVENPTSAVEYQIYYEVEFILTDDRFIEMEIDLIKELQAMFEKL